MASKEPHKDISFSLSKHKYKFKTGFCLADTFCINCGREVSENALCIFESGYSATDTSRPVACVNCKLCPSVHKLGYNYDLSVFGFGTYDYNEYYCDVCSRTKKNDKGVLHCISCEFDMCPECERMIFHYEIE